MSNRGRIDRMREEADATSAEKGTKPAETGRMAAVWAVKDGHGEVVAKIQEAGLEPFRLLHLPRPRCVVEIRQRGAFGKWKEQNQHDHEQGTRARALDCQITSGWTCHMKIF